MELECFMLTKGFDGSYCWDVAEESSDANIKKVDFIFIFYKLIYNSLSG